MKSGWVVVACMTAFICGILFAAEGLSAREKKRAATGIIFIDNVPYSVRPFNREAPEG